MSLIPKESTKPKEALEDHTIFLHGPPKIGKSTFAAQFNKPLFLATEAGLNSLETYQIPIRDEIVNGKKILAWGKFLQTLTELMHGKHEFRTLVIDTVDNLAEYCSEYVYDVHRIQHASDLDWGKGWQLLKAEAQRGINLLMSLGLGVIFVSHSEEKEIRRKKGDSYTKIQDTCPRNFKHMIHALSDMILYATMENGKPVLKTRESDEYLAGSRVGLPETLPFEQPEGNLSKAYESFVSAFYAAKSDKKPSKSNGQNLLIEKILKGEQWLADHGVDGFDVEKRVHNSRNLHLKTKNLKDASLSDLEAYFQHLRQKAKENKNESVSKN